MSFYVYIIQSQIDLSYYKGSTADYLKRLSEHNSGLSTYTARKIPWQLVHVEVHETRASELAREKALKKVGGERLQAIIRSARNILNNSSD